MNKQSLAADLAEFFDRYDGYGGDVVGQDRQADWVKRARDLEAKLEAMEQYIAEVLRVQRGSDVLAFVHGLPNDYSKANELWWALPDDTRERIAAAQEEQKE